MTKLEQLNRKMLELEHLGDISEEEYATYKQLIDAVEHLALLSASYENIYLHHKGDMFPSDQASRGLLLDETLELLERLVPDEDNLALEEKS